MAKSKVYKNPQAGSPLLSTISSGCKTPVLEIKFCNLIKPFYYPNSPMIPRYSITCLVDPKEHKEFLDGVKSIEKNEGVDSIIKFDTKKEDGQTVNTGKLLIKFQSKEIIPVYLKKDNQEEELIELEDELARKEKVIVVYDILRYTKKNTVQTEHGLSFKPTSILYFSNENLDPTEAA
jgi:hypothetical protein